MAQFSIYLTYPIPVFAPIYIAKEKGFFKEYGLDVSVEFPGEGHFDPFAAGTTPFGRGINAAIRLRARRGVDVKIIMELANMGGHFLLARPEIKSLEEIKGKRIGVHPGSSTEFDLRTFLRLVNLSLIDVILAQAGFADEKVDHFLKGEVDAILAHYDTVIRLRGQQPSLHLLGENLEIAGQGMFTSPRMIREQPDVVKGFIKAMIKAIDWAKTQRDEAIEVLLKTCTHIKDPKEVVGVYDLYVKKWNADISVNTLKNMLQSHYESYGDRKIEPEEILDLSMLQAARAELRQEGYRGKLGT